MRNSDAQAPVGPASSLRGAAAGPVPEGGAAAALARQQPADAHALAGGECLGYARKIGRFLGCGDGGEDGAADRPANLVARAALNRCAGRSMFSWGDPLHSSSPHVTPVAEDPCKQRPALHMMLHTSLLRCAGSVPPPPSKATDARPCDDNRETGVPEQVPAVPGMNRPVVTVRLGRLSRYLQSQG